jgi:hypothetical protein
MFRFFSALFIFCLVFKTSSIFGVDLVDSKNLETPSIHSIVSGYREEIYKQLNLNSNVTEEDFKKAWPNLQTQGKEEFLDAVVKGNSEAQKAFVYLTRLHNNVRFKDYKHNDYKGMYPDLSDIEREAYEALGLFQGIVPQSPWESFQSFLCCLCRDKEDRFKRSFYESLMDPKDFEVIFHSVAEFYKHKLPHTEFLFEYGDDSINNLFKKITLSKKDTDSIVAALVIEGHVVTVFGLRKFYQSLQPRENFWVIDSVKGNYAFHKCATCLMSKPLEGLHVTHLDDYTSRLQKNSDNNCSLYCVKHFIQLCGALQGDSFSNLNKRNDFIDASQKAYSDFINDTKGKNLRDFTEAIGNYQNTHSLNSILKTEDLLPSDDPKAIQSHAEQRWDMGILKLLQQLEKASKHLEV